MNNPSTGGQISVTRNVSLSQREDDIVTLFSRQSGIGVYSAALRVIITQWDAMTNRAQDDDTTSPPATRAESN